MLGSQRIERLIERRLTNINAVFSQELVAEFQWQGVALVGKERQLGGLPNRWVGRFFKRLFQKLRGPTELTGKFGLLSCKGLVDVFVLLKELWVVGAVGSNHRLHRSFPVNSA